MPNSHYKRSDMDLAERFNQDCHCFSVDAASLARELDRGAETALVSQLISERKIFAEAPVFVARAHVARMQEVIAAAETVLALPSLVAESLAGAPSIAHHAFGPRGVFMSYDFHLGPSGPKLIEINTNAGGALLNLALARAQRACCTQMGSLVVGPVPLAALDDTFVEMFRTEWRSQRGSAPLTRIAIVDEAPEQQFLYPEFLLFRALFRRAGIGADIVAPDSLAFREGRLEAAGAPIDLVYNRSTDFYFEAPESAALRAAYEAGAVVVTPHPRAHALHANKRLLVVLSDSQRLEHLGVTAELLRVLAEGVPATVPVDPNAAERFWQERKRWFFKPASGYGGKAAYRGDKLTRGVFADILAKDYVAQELVVPSQRMVVVGGERVPLKLDLRAYVYSGGVQLLAARLYRGQTTNFRTPGGGFAPVFTEAV